MTKSGHMRQLGVALGIALAMAWGEATGGELTVSAGEKGLASLTYGKTELLADGELRVTGAFFREPRGDVYAADLSKASKRVGPIRAAAGSPARSGTRQELRFPWGTVTATYAQNGSVLAIDIVIQTHDDADELVGLYVQPLSLKFPAAPKLTNRSWLFYMTSTMGHNHGAPGFVGAEWGQGVLAICNEQLVRPLAVGFAPATKGAAHTYPVLAYTARHPMATKKFPWIDRPLPQGGRDRWRLTLRFGPPKTPYNRLVKDLYARFAKAFPYELKWPDRRPIAQCVLSSSGQGWKGNPRGWHHGMRRPDKLDIATEAGKEIFKKHLPAYADQVVAIGKEMNAQGVIVWDVEGQEQPHMISYLGDPRSLPAEMRLPVGEGKDAKPVVDVFFDRLRKAGLRTGICIRPQRPMRAIYDKKVSQVSWVNRRKRFGNLSAKIAYARKRWGCTLFYLDSDVVWYGDPAAIPGAGGYSALVDAQMLRDLTKANPGILILPEWEDLRSYAYAAPYTQLNYNKHITPPDYVRLAYPKAFFVNRVDVKSGRANKDALVESVKQGNILFYVGWYAPPENALIKAIYEAAGKGKP